MSRRFFALAVGFLWVSVAQAGSPPADSASQLEAAAELCRAVSRYTDTDVRSAAVWRKATHVDAGRDDYLVQEMQRCGIDYRSMSVSPFVRDEEWLRGRQALVARISDCETSMPAKRMLMVTARLPDCKTSGAAPALRDEIRALLESLPDPASCSDLERSIRGSAVVLSWEFSQYCDVELGNLYPLVHRIERECSHLSGSPTGQRLANELRLLSLGQAAVGDRPRAATPNEYMGGGLEALVSLRHADAAGLESASTQLASALISGSHTPAWSVRQLALLGPAPRIDYCFWIHLREHSDTVIKSSIGY